MFDHPKTLYTVYQKERDLDIIDRNMKIGYQILIIFGTDISNNWPSNNYLIYHPSLILLLHYFMKYQCCSLVICNNEFILYSW